MPSAQVVVAEYLAVAYQVPVEVEELQHLLVLLLLQAVTAAALVLLLTDQEQQVLLAVKAQTMALMELVVLLPVVLAVLAKLILNTGYRR